MSENDLHTREALNKAGFPNFIFFTGWENTRRGGKLSLAAPDSQPSPARTWPLTRFFSPLHAVGGVVFHALARRAPIRTLARPKRV